MAAAAPESSWPQTTTASTCSPDAARGTHVFKVAGYSLHKGLGVDRFIRSATFAVGGYHWAIRYYPDGITWCAGAAGRVVVYLELMSNKQAEVRALFDFMFLDDQATAAIHCWATPVVLFSTIDKGNRSWGTFSVLPSSVIEASSYLRDDTLTIQCNVTVIKEPRVEPELEVQVPPSDLSGNLGKLLEGKKGADVTFKVGDELFYAHKAVLATRSPIFDAEFYGPMAADMRRQCLTIEDMHPDVFRALLHFIYTDSMPGDG